MANFTFEWDSVAFEQEVQSVLVEKLDVVGRDLTEAMISNISTPGPGQPRSEPGEFPHVDTGTLRASVEHEVEEKTLTVRVGTNVLYGLYLELGAYRGRTVVSGGKKYTFGNELKPRPWLKPTFVQQKQNLIAIITE